MKETILAAFALLILVSCNTPVNSESGLRSDSGQSIDRSLLQTSWIYYLGDLNGGLNQMTNFLNANPSPASIFNIRMLNSQRTPGGNYYFRSWAQNDQSRTRAYSANLTWIEQAPNNTDISGKAKWVVDTLSDLQSGTRIPVAIYHSSGSGEGLIKVETTVPNPSSGTWKYYHYKDEWSAIVDDINREKPSDVSGIIVICSQTSPGGSYDLHCFIRNDNAKWVYSLTCDGLPANWDTNFSTSLQQGSSAPLTFYQSLTPSVPTRVWTVTRLFQLP